MASSSTENNEKIVLITSDGETFEVEKAAALLSQTVKNMIDDDCTAGGIPLPNVHSNTMARVLDFCKHHAGGDAAKRSSDGEHLTKNFDTEFVDSVKDNQELLFDLILAANYLDIRDLLNLLCGAVADMIKGKTPEEIRKKFNIKNDYSPEEEEEVRRENAWAFEE